MTSFLSRGRWYRARTVCARRENRRVARVAGDFSSASGPAADCGACNAEIVQSFISAALQNVVDFLNKQQHRVKGVYAAARGTLHPLYDRHSAWVIHL